MGSFRRLVAAICVLSALYSGAGSAMAQEDTGAGMGIVVLEDIIAKQRNPDCAAPQTLYDPWTGAISYACPVAAIPRRAARPARSN
jgi:hypothetical protein